MTILLGNSQRCRLNLQVQSLIFLFWVFLSTEKAYSFFPRLTNLELILFINMLLLHGLNPSPSLYNISAKNHLNCLQNLLFESLFLWVFVAIFGCGNIFHQELREVLLYTWLELNTIHTGLECDIVFFVKLVILLLNTRQRYNTNVTWHCMIVHYNTLQIHYITLWTLTVK